MGPEGWPEWAESDPGKVRAMYLSLPPNMQAALDVVARAHPARLTYGEVEDELDWRRGKLRSVIGGSRSHLGADAKRPYHICPPDRSRRGEWEIWLDVEQASALS